MKRFTWSLRGLFRPAQRVFQGARAGSVLILVIALLVLLALMGTAYISTARTERYSSQQHVTNSEAAQLLNGLMNSVAESVADGTYGSSIGTAGAPRQYRPASQEMPAPATNALFSYVNWDGFAGSSSGALTVGPAGTVISPDLFLADRIPTLTDTLTNTNAVYNIPVTWGGLSWPLFTDGNGNYVFDSPFENGTTEVPVNTFLGTNRALIRCYPASKVENGVTYPGLLLYVPGGQLYEQGSAAPIAVGGAGYLTPCPYAFNGGTETSSYTNASNPNVPLGYQAQQFANPTPFNQYNSYVVFAADADGDGIADSPLWKLPIGPIDGITYYAAVRVIDNNAALNVSTAYETEDDPNSTLTIGGTTYNSAYMSGMGLSNAYLNYGFYRSNIGLQEALYPAPTGSSPPSAQQEMNALNEYRFAGVVAPASTASPPTLTMNVGATTDNAYDDLQNKRTDFTFYSYGDELDSQLARRGLNPGYGDTSLGVYKFSWIGFGGSAPMAYRFCLSNPSAGSSPLEQSFSNETLIANATNKIRTTPYQPGQYYSTTANAANWYSDQFAPIEYSPGTPSTIHAPQLRSLLVGSNAQSNAIPTRYGNMGAAGQGTAIAAFDGNNVYQFGDLVKGSDGYTYVSLCSDNNAILLPISSSNDPPGATNTEFGANLYTNGALPVATTFNTLATTSAHYGNDPTISTGQVSPAVYENPFWGRVSFSSVPVKASANTSSFEELWMAYCHVMTDAVVTSAGQSGFSRGSMLTNTPLLWDPPLTATGAANSLGTYGAKNDTEPQLGMFRNVIRTVLPQSVLAYDPIVAMHVMQIRAALAAVNTMDMRDGDDDVTSRHIVLDDVNGKPLYDVEVFGNEKQPYIAEVDASIQSVNDPTKNSILIELDNPYPTPIVVSKNWQFGLVPRPVAAATPSTLTMTSLGTLGSDVVIPPATGNVPGHGYIYGANVPTNLPPSVPANYATQIGSATYTIPSSCTNEGSVANLEQVITQSAASAYGGELVILRPRLADTPQRDQDTVDYPDQDVSSSTDPKDAYNEKANIADLVPVDQVDFSYAPQLPTTMIPCHLHYRRADAPTTVAPSYAWNFVYPGPYYATAVGTTAPTNQPGVPSTQNYLREAFQIDQSGAGGSASPSMNEVKQGYPPVAGNNTPTYYTAAVEMNNADMGGPNPTFTQTATEGPTANAVNNAQVNHFPFGGFARNGDLLQVPYIGAYRIRAWTKAGSQPLGVQTFLEMNSVTADCACAWDTTLAESSTTPTQSNAVTGATELVPQGAAINQLVPNAAWTSVQTLGATFYEQIGHFCPVGDSGADGSAPAPATSLDFLEPTATNGVANYWHYHWTRKLFDYLTVNAPAEDFFPNVDATPRFTSATYGSQNPMATPPPATTTYPPVAAKYPPYDAPAYPAADMPEPVANRQPAVANTTSTASEDTVGVEGLININTAPVAVLAQLPFVPKGTNNIQFTPLLTAQANPQSYGSAAAESSGTPQNVDDNAEIAAAIVAYRNVNGPFKSIFDLYKVPAFALENQMLWQVAQEPTPLIGYFDGARPAYSSVGVQNWVNGSDSPRIDFSERFLLLDRISNLITTRSDSFTCYVLIQGWRGVGSGAPTLAVQKRAAFYLDRTGVTPSNVFPMAFPIPTQ